MLGGFSIAFKGGDSDAQVSAITVSAAGRFFYAKKNKEDEHFDTRRIADRAGQAARRL